MMNKITKDHIQVWENCLVTIRDIVGEQAYETWFTPIVPVSLEGDTLVIQLPSHLYYEFLEEHYVNVLRSVIKKELGQSGKLTYKVVMEQKQDPAQSQSITLPSHHRPAVSNPPTLAPIDVFQTSNRDIPDPFVLPGIQKHKIPSNLVDTLTFDNYIEGDCNRLARAAGWAISKAPGSGTAFNPLFIYGGSGLGKTHLAQAIGIETKDRYQDKVVLYVTGHEFSTQFADATMNNNRNDFLHFYQMIDLLIIDDIH